MLAIGDIKSCHTMADESFTFEAMNEDEGGGPSEDEYDALNDETFGDGLEQEWEEEHEQLAHITESSRRSKDHLDLEASLSRLVLDEADTPPRPPAAPAAAAAQPAWPQYPGATASVGALKNVCTVEELERQLRQAQPARQPQHQNYFQPRFPTVILQRPPGLQGPVPLPFAPQPAANQQGMGQMMAPANQHAMTNQMGINHSQMGSNNQMAPGSQMMNGNQFGMGHMGQNQLQMMPPHMMGQPRMMGPPSGPNGMPRQHFNNGMGHFNQNFRGPMDQQAVSKQQNMMNHQMGNQPQGMNQQMGSQPQGMNQQMGNQPQGMNQQIGNQPQGMNQQIGNQPQGMNQQMGNPLQGMNQQMGNQPQGMNQQMGNPPQGINQQMGNQPQGMNQQMGNQPQGMNQQPVYNQSAPQMINQMNQSQQQFNQSKMNQSPQSSMNQSQKRSQDAKLKPQTRIFNNSNLSSQNLVQLIQNTHPMLQMHNSLHNASHHPVLNVRSNVFGGPMMSGNHQFSGQRNGGYGNNNRYANGDDMSNGHSTRDSSDEYAGLMSQREKHWLLNIQMLQLNTGTPYMDDYYYTVFLERRSRQKQGVKEAHKANQQNHPFYSGGKQEGRERHRHNSSSEEQPAPRTYVPAQFENSLGKLQCGSVTAPRKIIDVEVVRESEPGGAPAARLSRAPSVASTTHPHEGPREVRRTKQSLLDIEALYLVLLRLEELNEPLAIANAFTLREREEKARLAEAQRAEEEGEPAPPAEGDAARDTNLFLRNIESVQRRAPAKTVDAAPDKRHVVSLSASVAEPPRVRNLLDESKDELVGKMFAGLLHEDRLQVYLGIRKGKMLVARFVARVPATHARLRALWARVLRALPAVARRDARDDNLLPRLAAPFRRYISGSSGWAAVLEASAHLAEALDPARPPHALLTPLTLSCVVALAEKASTLTNTAEATSSERQWSKFLKSVARALKAAGSAAPPAEPLRATDLLRHVRLLESRATVEILQRGRPAAEYADLGRNELGEVLARHLC